MSKSNFTGRAPDEDYLIGLYSEGDNELREIILQLVTGLAYHGDATVVLCDQWNAGEINRDELLRGLWEINSTTEPATVH